MLPGMIVIMLGAVWIALGLFAYAIFVLLGPSLGVAGAAAATGAIFLIVAAIGALIVKKRVETLKNNAVMASLATSGAANFALGMVTKRPLVSLGVAGAIAALLFARGGSSK